jgi:hypothetical protein
MLGVAVIGAITQGTITRAVISAERKRLAEQLRGESDARQTETLRALLLESVSKLLATTDPEANARIDYRRTVTMIHRIQVMLDRDDHGLEAKLNGAVNLLGMSVREHLASPDAVTVEAILAAQGQVIDFSRALVRGALTAGIHMQRIPR